MLYIQESGSIRSPINAEPFPLVYSLLSLFVTAYTNIGVAPESACAKSTRAPSVASACAKNTSARAAVRLRRAPNFVGVSFRLCFCSLTREPFWHANVRQ